MLVRVDDHSVHVRKKHPVNQFLLVFISRDHAPAVVAEVSESQYTSDQLVLMANCEGLSNGAATSSGTGSRKSLVDTSIVQRF